MRHVLGTDSHAVRLLYFRRILAERWQMPTRTPTLVTVGRDGGRMAADLARVGFRITVADLPELTHHERTFDVVCWSGRLEQLDAWNAVVGMAAQLLPSGGVFLFGGIARPGWRTLFGRNQPITQQEVLVTLRQEGFWLQEIVGLSKGIVGSAPCMGYAVRDSDSREPRASGRWCFLASEQQWAFVPVIAGPEGDCSGRACSDEDASDPEGP